MKFTAVQKTCVHGVGMVAFALGSLANIPLVNRIEKNKVAILGILISILGNVLLFVFFIGGVTDPQYAWHIGSFNIPVSVILFGAFQFLWHGGNGVIIPLSMSMMADVSEISKIRFGRLKDGSYSAMYSFIFKAACSVGLVLCGLILDFSGYISEAGAVQSFSVAKNVAIATFVCGPVVFLLTLPILIKYPINRTLLGKFRMEE
jgi:glycoside/pentoside/hexuronide:cation symporter, GPH family